MAIIRLESNRSEVYPTGTYCRLNKNDEFPVVISRSHEGLCLFESEMNGYHDSDFYMTVWNEEKGKPERILFASTRGWCEPCFGSAPDATEEVWEKYRNWEREQKELERKRKRAEAAKHYIKIRLEERKALTKYNLNPGQIVKLRKGYGGWKRINLTPDYEAVLNLLNNTRIRSKFKLSLREQVIAWLNEEHPKYATPLSTRQLIYI